MEKAYKFDVFALLVIRIMAEIIPAYVKIAKKTTEIWAAASYNGEAQPKKRMKRRNLERSRLRLKEQYESGSRSLKDYWVAMARQVGHFH